MAQKVTFVDDLDGTLIEGDGGTVSFSIEGVNYEIDLSTENAFKLRSAFDKYVDAGRRVRRDGNASPLASGRGKRDPKRLRAIREWAAKNGHNLSDRGPIPTEVRKAYDDAHVDRARSTW